LQDAQFLAHDDRQQVFAQVPGSVPLVIGTLTLAVTHLVPAQSVLRRHSVAVISYGNDGAQEEQKGGLIQTTGEVRALAADLFDNTPQFLEGSRQRLPSLFATPVFGADPLLEASARDFDQLPAFSRTKARRPPRPLSG